MNSSIHKVPTITAQQWKYTIQFILLYFTLTTTSSSDTQVYKILKFFINILATLQPTLTVESSSKLEASKWPTNIEFKHWILKHNWPLITPKEADNFNDQYYYMWIGSHKDCKLRSMYKNILIFKFFCDIVLMMIRCDGNW